MARRKLPRRAGRNARPNKRTRRRRRSLILRSWWFWAPPIALATAMAVALAFVYVRLPLPPEPTAEQTTFVYANNGRLLTTLRGEVDRRVIPFEEMPRHLREAIIAAEDEQFYEHPGVSVAAIIRAAWANIRGRRIQQGASTIPMQYVRNVFRDELGYDRRTGFEKTIGRKLKEALLAVKLEEKLTKDQILERYLNTIYFGRSAYGVEAAARTFFGVPAAELTVAQSATLAGLIPRPVAADLFNDPDEALAQRNRVLNRMAEAGFISPQRARELQGEELGVVDREPTKKERRRNVLNSPAAYFVDYTSRQLQREFGEQTFIGGLRVRSTIDMRMQRAAEQAVTNHLGAKGDPDVALVAMDPRNGEIRAMIGGKNFNRARCNLATSSPINDECGTGRQTGSAAKILTLAAAVDKGISLRSRFSGPGRIVLKDSPECGSWATKGVSNYSDSGSGTMDLIGATARSVNTIYAQLIAEVGIERVVEMSHKLGIESPIPSVCSITLGTADVSALEMTSVVATLASGGVRHKATPIRTVRAPDGEVLFRNAKNGERVMKKNDAWQVVHALKSVVTGGTGTAANLPGVDEFGKTGTSENHANAYFCGGTRVLVACVWVGFKKGNIPMTGVRGIRVTGGSFPARIWRDFMAKALEGLDVPGFPTPQFTGKLVKGKGVSTEETEKKKKKRKPVTVPVTASPSPSPPPTPPDCTIEPLPEGCPGGTESGGSGTSSGDG